MFTLYSPAFVSRRDRAGGVHVLVDRAGQSARRSLMHPNSLAKPFRLDTKTHVRAGHVTVSQRRSSVATDGADHTPGSTTAAVRDDDAAKAFAATP